MNFRTGARDEPEINLIPFIDILLVVLIFLMLSTTYSKFTELQVSLPVANAQLQQPKNAEVAVNIGRDGRYAINGVLLEAATVERLTSALVQAAQGQVQAVVVINADAAATHQSVIQVMDAARRGGLAQIVFTTQQTAAPSPRRP